MNDLNEILQSHIKDTQDFQRKAIEKLSSIETHNQYTHERLDKVEVVTEDYKRHKNYLYGAMIVISSIFAFIVDWIKDLFHK